MKTKQFIPDIAIHPGETLKEVLDERGMSNKELALRTSKPERTISRVLNGKSGLTSEMAIAFEKVLELPATFWMNLQRDYDETLARIDYNNRCVEASEWAKQFPYPKMASLGWVPKTSKAYEKAANLFQFFRVSSESAWVNSYVDGGLRVAHRLDLAHNSNKQAITAWLRQGEILASRFDLPDYNEKKLKQLLPTLKDIMASGEPNFFDKLNVLCREVGVCVLLVPNLPGAPIHGSCRWLKGTPVIQLSVRYKQYDKFWFTFFHELAHILLHGNTYVSLELDQYNPLDQSKEDEADHWAAEWLLSNEDFLLLLECDYKNVKIIMDFAKSVNTHPSVVIGRLQREGFIPYNDWNLNRLLTKLDFK